MTALPPVAAPTPNRRDTAARPAEQRHASRSTHSKPEKPQRKHLASDRAQAQTAPNAPDPPEREDTGETTAPRRVDRRRTRAEAQNGAERRVGRIACARALHASLERESERRA